MSETIKFAVIGDCHHSYKANYATRDCLGAKKRLTEIIELLNEKELDFVFSLGDLGDGHEENESSEMLEVFASSKHPVKYAVGNHDLCTRSDIEHMSLVGMPSPTYDFSIKGFRIVVLNAFERSRYSRNKEDHDFYWDFRKNNPDVPVQEWPGLMRDETWEWLEGVFNDAEEKGENVIIFSHVPAWNNACERPMGDPGEKDPTARIIEHERMLALMDRYPNIRAYIAGHYHPGGLAVRKGVMHKTVRSICDFKEPTACIMIADENQIKVDGIGMETNFIHQYPEAE